jgi:1,4-dihydroxy-2-naphthoyl-CoA hydrolase
MAELPTTADSRDALAELLGLEYLERGPELVRARAAVSESILQPRGLVHGGAMTAFAESACSRATLEAVREEGMIALGQSLEATFLRPISAGHVNVIARPRRRGRTVWVWDVEIADDEENLCALVRMIVAVRPG